MEAQKSDFKQDAKFIVDSLFDGKLFHDGVTRDDMNVIQDHIDYCMSSRFDLRIKSYSFIQKHKGKTSE